MRLGLREVTETGFAAAGEIQVRKNMLAVHLNPAISEVLGYQPGGPLFLQPGWFGELEWTVMQPLRDDQSETLAGLDWIVELSLLPVTVFD